MFASALEQIKTGFDGWKNLAVKQGDIEQLFQRRRDICATCEHKQALTCGLCGCPLAAKLRATDASCPDRRW